MYNSKEHWLQALANLKKGTLLREAILGQEQFLRNPCVLSPLAKDGYKKYTTSQLPHYLGTANTPWYAHQPVWDGVMVDEVTRKIVLLTAFGEPEEVKKGVENTGKDRLAAKVKYYYDVADVVPWLDLYYPVAEKLVLIKELNEPQFPCFESGWRCEMFILNFADAEGVLAPAPQRWEDFYEQVWEALFPRGEEGTVDLFFNMLFHL